MKYIKIYVVILLFCFLSCISTNIAIAENTKSGAKEYMEKLGIISQDDEILKCETLTRRQGLKIAATIKSHGWYPMYSSQSQMQYLNICYDDITDNTEDCNLVVMSTIQQILRGKYDVNENRIADLDSTLTYQDAIIMLERVLFTEWTSEELICSEFGAEWWLKWGEEQKLINCGYAMEAITVDKSAEAIPTDIFLQIAYRTLYIPRVIETYGGNMEQYHIEAFLK